ncbi:restriction endonuclease subunit S [Arthrobacter sp. UYCu723]
MTGTKIDGWTRVRLGEVGQSIIGLTYEPSSVKPMGTLVLRSSNVQNGRLAFDDNVYVDCPVPERIRVRDGDILICVRNGSRRLIGKSAMLDKRVSGETFGAFMAVYRSKANRFVQYFFQSNEFKRQIDEHLGATINQITNGSLNSFMVSLPATAEQEEIASRLADVDNMIDTLERFIAKKQSIKLSLLQQLLTGRTRLPGFSQPWSHVRLNDIGIFLKGRGIKRDDVRRAGTPCIRYGELYTAFTDYTSTTVSFVDDDIAATALPIRSGDLLFAGSGETREEIGKCVTYTGSTKAVAGGDIVILRGQGFNPVYLASLTNTPLVASQKSRRGQGDAVVHISSRALGELEVSLPPRPEQDAIAAVLMDSDGEIRLLRKRLAKTKNIKRGMMQELLTGRTRLQPVEATS